jgi:integrase
MASLRSEIGRLFIDFRWKGVRCREWTGKTDTSANRAAMRRLVKQIEGEIAGGTFDYLRFFPEGGKRELFSSPTPRAEIPSVAEHARSWIDHRRPWLAGGTEYDYRRIIESHLITRLGERLVSELTVEDIQEFIATIKEGPGTRGRKLSNRRANMILTVVRLVLDPVVKHGWLEENPARQVENLKEEKSQIDPFSFQEVRQLLSKGFRTAEEQRYFTVAFFSGLRPSEEIGLQWDALDWVSEPPLIGVQRGVTRHGGTSRPKTSGSYREVVMVPIVERALRDQRASSELRSIWVFPNERGGHLNLTNLRERTWKPALRRAGIRARPLYQTRHTFATLALASGEDIGWVAKMLGHANTEMVIRHYHKFIPNLTRRDSSALARRIEELGWH